MVSSCSCWERTAKQLNRFSASPPSTVLLLLMPPVGLNLPHPLFLDPTIPRFPSIHCCHRKSQFRT